MRFIRYKTPPTYSPGANYLTLRDEMDRIFEVAFPSLGSLQRGGLFGDWQNEFPVDLYQDKDGYSVRAELPGFRKEDISLDLDDGILTITGHQKSETKAEDKEMQKAVQERRVSRALSLPDNVVVDKIAATYENGVLTVTLPKREDAKPRQITVEVK